MNIINIEEIVIVNTAGVLILVLSLLSRIEITRVKHFDDYLFQTMIGITIGALGAEMLTFLLDGRPGGLVHFLQYLLNAYLFLASCGNGMLWVLYVDYRLYHSLKRIRRRLIMVAVPFLLIAVLVICDLFGTGIIFSITEQNVYLRGKMVMLSYLILFYEYCMSVVLAIFAVKRDRNVRFFPILTFVLLCIAGTVIQGVNYGISTGWFCVSLAFMLVQLHLTNQTAFVDELSGLYNRKYYHYVIQKLSDSKKDQKICGIMMDANDFKGINDQLGHTVGDDAIRSIGKLISSVTTECDMAFRLAGDEFIIISTVGNKQYVELLIHTLTENVEKFNENANKPYKLSLAIGYTMWQTSELNSDSFLHQMDLKMYEAKSAYYSQKGADRRKGDRR